VVGGTFARSDSNRHRLIRQRQVGPITYRDLRREGKTAFPPAVQLDRGTVISVPSSEQGRQILCRVIPPSSGGQPRGIFLHFHGGGFVMGGMDQQDMLLARVADEVQLTCVSVEYRLAPEYAAPAALDDCSDVANWMASNARERFGCDLAFLGGEVCCSSMLRQMENSTHVKLQSAGGTLTAQVLLRLREKFPRLQLKGSVLNYGWYDFSILPAGCLASHMSSPILGYEDVTRFAHVYHPNARGQDFKSKHISPVYNDLSNLGPALFIVGTEDGLVDDTVLMHWRWRRFGNEAVLKFVPGAPHGFMLFGDGVECTKQGVEMMVQYLKERA
jgi:acetyl esterase/lipase